MTPIQRKSPGDDRRREVLGILIMAFGLLLFLGLVSHHPSDFPNSGSPSGVENWLGLAGAWISHFLFVYTIGYSSLLFPFIIFLLGWHVFLQRSYKPFLRLALTLLGLGLFLSTALALPEAVSAEGSKFGYRLSGNLGGFFAYQLNHFLGTAGSIVVLLTFLLLFLVSATSWSMREALTGFRDEIIGFFKGLKRTKPLIEKSRESKIIFPKKESGPVKMDFPKSKPEFKPVDTRQKQPPAIRKEPVQVKPPAAPGSYTLPSTDLLESPSGDDTRFDRHQLEKKAHYLEEKLHEFGIQGKVVGIRPGPVITRFEIRPAPGVKISRFVSYQDDLALVMQASRVRVVAPIPGKAAVGIEIPNSEPNIVLLRGILESKSFHETPGLPLALGKTIEGKPYITDLAQLPHLLVAGATGSGKSVCLNTIITSILFRTKPHLVKFVLIDPKKLELTLYQELKHHHLISLEGLSEDVITTVDNAIAVLRSLELEMERRYRILARAGVRNIRDYNLAIKHGKLPKNDEGKAPSFLTYIILVVDELADLMMTGAREVEEPVARLAQMSRAVGIHLILATQRPSVDVITGVIKANFPSRIAFQVTSKTDSRTILDRNGAEKLLGRGDMLFMHPREPEPLRIHGAYVSTEEVNRVVQHVAHQPRSEVFKLPSTTSKSGVRRGGINGERDELFEEAAKLVIRHQQGSASLLQRRLRIGYARAGRLIDELEDAGIVGPFDGSKAREVLVDETHFEKLNNPDFTDEETL